jgi:hypothetical protein
MEQLKPSSRKDDKVLPAITSNSLTDIDTILYFAGKLQQTSAAKKLASKAHDLNRKHLKNAGVTMQVFDVAVKLSELDDPEAISAYIKELLHIAGAFSAPIGTQITLFDGPASALSAVDQSEKEGYQRGLMGLNIDDQKYHVNTDLGRAHEAGWSRGQKVLQDKFVAQNEKIRQEEVEKQAAADEKAKKKVERAAKKIADGVRDVRDVMADEAGEAVQ